MFINGSLDTYASCTKLAGAFHQPLACVLLLARACLPAILTAFPRTDGDVTLSFVRTVKVGVGVVLHRPSEEGFARITGNAAKVVAFCAIAANTADLDRSVALCAELRLRRLRLLRVLVLLMMPRRPWRGGC